MTSVYGIIPGDRTPALETRALTVLRDEGAVVKGVSMIIPTNRVVAVVGPSGCGKTTFLKSFNRMNDLDDDVRVEGPAEGGNGLPEPESLSHIGFRERGVRSEGEPLLG